MPLNVALLDIPNVAGMFNGADEAVDVTSFPTILLKSASDVFLPTERRTITAGSYTNPAFKNGVRELLAVRLLENGICSLAEPDPYGPAMPVDVFSVSKGDATPEDPTSAQRLVWDCRRANEAIHPPPSFALGYLAALSELELPEKGFLEVAATDVSAYFYRLTLPILERLIYLADADVAKVVRILKARGRTDLLGVWNRVSPTDFS